MSGSKYLNCFAVSSCCILAGIFVCFGSLMFVMSFVVSGRSFISLVEMPSKRFTVRRFVMIRPPMLKKQTNRKVFPGARQTGLGAATLY